MLDGRNAGWRFIEARAATTMTEPDVEPGHRPAHLHHHGARRRPGAVADACRQLRRTACWPASLSTGRPVAPLALTVNGQPVQVVQVAPAPAAPRARCRALRARPASRRPCRSPTARGRGQQPARRWRTLTVTPARRSPTTTSPSRYTTSNGSATAPADYLSVTGGVVIVPAGADQRAGAGRRSIGDGSYRGRRDGDRHAVEPGRRDPRRRDRDVSPSSNDEPIVAVADAYATPYLHTADGAGARRARQRQRARIADACVAILISPTCRTARSRSAATAVHLHARPPGSPASTASPIAPRPTRRSRQHRHRVASRVAAADHRAAADRPARVGDGRQPGHVPLERPGRSGRRRPAIVLEGGVAPAQPMVALPTGLAAPILDDRRAVRIVLRAHPHAGRRRTERRLQRDPGAHRRAGAAVAADRCCRPSASATRCTWRGRRPSAAARRAGSCSTSAARSPRRCRCPTSNGCRSPALPAASYTLSLRAVNAGGSSAPSAPVPLPVPGACAGPPGPPTNLLAYVNGGTTFVVWDPPATGSPPSSYLVTVPGIGALPLAQRTISGPLPAGHLVDQRAGRSAPAVPAQRSRRRTSCPDAGAGRDGERRQNRNSRVALMASVRLTQRRGSPRSRVSRPSL